MFVTTYTYMVTWIRTAETAAKRIRENYLRAILRQDVAFFDNVGAGEVATRIQTDTHLIQQGVSEKVPIALSFIGAFITGFIIAFVRNWKLSLAISSIVPCIAITGGLMNFFMSKLKLRQLTHVAEGGSLAEEVIGTIRTAQAFGTQNKLSEMYDVHIDRTHAVDNKLSIIVSNLLQFPNYLANNSLRTVLVWQSSSSSSTLRTVLHSALELPSCSLVRSTSV